MKYEVIQSILKENEAGYNRIARHFSQTRKMPWQLFNLFLPYIKEGAHILDAGCGNGRLYEFLKNKKISYWGLDSSRELLNIAKEKFPGANFQTGNIINPPYQNEKFDIIFCLATLHHIPGKKLRKKALLEFNRTAKNNGWLIMSNWNLWNIQWWPTLIKFSTNKLLNKHSLDWRDVEKNWKNPAGEIKAKRYLHAFTKREIKKLLQQTGWKIIKNYYTSHDTGKKFWQAYNLLTIAKKS